MKKLAFAMLAATLLCAVSDIPPATAQDYPTRTITLIVPFPAGGGVDSIARIVGERLSQALKQQVTIDNRASGGAILGTRAVAKAAPDGYTLLLGHTGTISINPSIYANVGYDPRTDFAPIGLIARIPIALVVHPSLPVKTVGELIAQARRQPGQLAIGTSVVGSGGYMSAELFKEAAGIDMTIVPYKGTGPLANDALGGHVPVSFNTLAPVLANIFAGNLRPLGVASLTRSALLPQVPTIAESACPVSRPCCATACWHRRERPRRSSRGSIASCRPWSPSTRSRSASRRTAAIPSPRPRRNTLPTSTARSASGAPSSASSA